MIEQRVAERFEIIRATEEELEAEAAAEGVTVNAYLGQITEFTTRKIKWGLEGNVKVSASELTRDLGGFLPGIEVVFKTTTPCITALPE